MKKNPPPSRSAFFNPRVLISFAAGGIGLLLALLVFGLYPGGKAFARSNQLTLQDQASTQELPQNYGPASNIPNAPETIVANTAAPDQATCVATALVNDTSSSANARAPSTQFAASRAVYLILASELAANGVLSGNSPTSLGWNYQAAPGISGGAPLTIYLQNTSDTTYGKGTSFSAAIVGMTMVHNATTMLPGTVGTFDITFSGGSAFTYTGGGLYVAYDWGAYTGALSTTTIVWCNGMGLPAGLAANNTGVDALDASAFRPETRLSCPNGTPSPTPTATATATIPPTPTATPTATGTPAPTATVPTSTPTPTPPYLVILWEGFDAVSAPALPAGWVTSFIPGPANCEPMGTCPLGTDWVTSTSTSQTAPNSAFHDAPGCVTDSRLDTPSVFVPPNNYGVDITFWHNYNLQAGFDGGVLEMSINGGPFTDFLAAGGTFINSSGYNGTISTAFLSPIAGRAAWTGNSGGYTRAWGHLGPSPHGYHMVLRFRLGTDCSGGGTGWSIDSLTVNYNAGDCCPTPTATATATAMGAPTPTPTPPPVCDLTEGFNAITTLVPSGWVIKNNSQSGPGPTNWFQGNSTRFPSQSGASNSYIAADFNNGIYVSTLSDWLLTPPLTLQNGAQLSFWTRTVTNVQFPDRMQVRMSTNGASLNVGDTATSVGDFTTLLLDINPTYTMTGYPNSWTNFVVTLSGLGAPTQGRLAFRYFVENGGAYGANSDYIGIDNVQFACDGGFSFNISGTLSYCSNPEPGPVPNVMLILTGSASGSTLSDGSGNYQFSSLAPGGSYTVTPTKAALAPGSAGINTVDVIAVQRHFLNIAPLSGCRLAAADVNGNTAVNTADVIAIQRFSLGLTFGTANVGKYQFAPASHSYTPLNSDQTAQNYTALVFGDVASSFVHRPEGPSQTAADDHVLSNEVPSTVAAVPLSEVGGQRGQEGVNPLRSDLSD